MPHAIHTTSIPTPPSEGPLRLQPRAMGTVALLRDLGKLKLTAMATLPAVLAYIAENPAPAGAPLFALAAGVLVSASGAAALNQWTERRIDCRMERTRSRPLPTAQVGASTVLAGGVAMLLLGSLALGLVFNLAAGLLALLAGLIYWLAYTPLKQKTPWCTEVGAISGALPVLIGSVAAAGSPSLFAWMLFAVLFFWQMPHFHPIGWRYREDYARAGLRMRVLTESSGNQAGNHSIVYALILCLVTLSPFLTGEAGIVSLLFCLTFGIAFIVFTLRFRFSENRDRAATSLFRFSLIYLPVVLLALTADKALQG
jgi:heme o synthase